MTDKTLDSQLLAFQQAFEGVTKGRKNTFTDSTYANLDDVWNAAEPVLSAHGLLAKQTLRLDSGRTILNCKICLIDTDQSIESEAYIDDDKGPQIFGSELSYKKRYLLCTMLNIVENNDDDGNAGADKPTATLTEKQHSEMIDLIDVTNTEMDKFNEHLANVFKVEEIEQLTIRQASTVVAQLKTKYKRLKDATN